MLVWLIDLLAADEQEAFEALGKITLRASVAALAAFLVAMICGRWVINWLRLRFREPNVSPSASLEKLNQDKHRTPTMGGLFIVAGLLVASVVLGDLTNPYLLATLATGLGLAAIGAVDDLAKLRGGQGLRVRTKLLGQVVVATVAAVWIHQCHQHVPGALELTPLPGLPTVSLGWWFVPLAVLVIVGASNAVNLTDGLDGLAGGCLIFATCAVGVLVYAAGHAGLAEYLRVTNVSGSGEVVIVAGSIVGALLGFLWFNCHPAQVFMGDTGSLSLGGLLGVMAIVCRKELLLIVIGGVFVVEAMSVIIQVVHFKRTGRRVFRCAPLHHHFQLSGWSESKIVVRFWIAAALCAIVGVGGLKLAARDKATHGNTQFSVKLFQED